MYKFPGKLNCFFKHKISYTCAIEAIKKNSCFLCLTELENRKNKDSKSITNEDVEFLSKGVKCSKWIPLYDPTKNTNAPPYKIVNLSVIAKKIDQTETNPALTLNAPLITPSHSIVRRTKICSKKMVLSFCCLFMISGVTLTCIYFNNKT